MYISSDRTFGRSFTILLALSFILAGLSSEVYLASHVTGFVVLVGGGGIMTLLSLTAKEADMNASLKRSRLFVQRTRLGSLVDELGLSPFSKQASELIASLKNLRGTIESKDPSAPGGVEIEELLVLAVDEVERKARHFMAAGSVEERDALLADAAILVEKAFNALHRREGVQEAE